MYVKMQASVLVSIKRWSEKRLVDYHASFQRGKQVGLMETILPLVFSTTKILEEDVPGFAAAAQERNGGGSLLDSNSYGIRVDHYIRSSLRNAFTKVALHIVVCVAFFFFLRHCLVLFVDLFFISTSFQIKSPDFLYTNFLHSAHLELFLE